MRHSPHRGALARTTARGWARGWSRAVAAGLLLAACAGEGEGGSLYSCAGAAPADGVDDGAGAPFVEVLSPGPAEGYLAGEPIVVTWRSRGGVERVDVDLVRAGDVVISIARDVEDAGAVEWLTPLGVAPRGDYRVRVTDADSGAAGESEAFGIDNWRYTRAVTVRTGEDEARTGQAVLVELTPGTFDFTRAAAGGADLRFASRPDRGDGHDLPHYVERWSATEGARVWVRLPAQPAAEDAVVHMFYGAAAPDASALDDVLVDRFDSVADLALGGEKSVDVFRLNAGHTLTVTPGQPLVIRARIIELGGTIDGSGAGYGGGAIGYAGIGPGAGGAGSSGGGGGGGYGGEGGIGGFHWPYFPGLGGDAHGTRSGLDIAPGSGGGGSYDVRGGDGGGSVELIAHTLIVGGAVVVDGAPGDDCSYAMCGGGGAGGGILLRAYDLSVTGTLRARGGDGGDGLLYDDGGGGGGGGRIKLFAARGLSVTGVAAVDGGDGGGGGGGGGSGEDGTVHSGAAPGPEPEAVVGAEALVFP